MTATSIKTRPVVCEICGCKIDGEFVPAGVDNYKIGRCCENLPKPYGFDADTGAYTHLLSGLNTDPNGEDYEEEEEICDCFPCRLGRGDSLSDAEICELTSDELDDYRNALEDFDRQTFPFVELGEDGVRRVEWRERED